MNFLGAMFYENYLTSDFHTNTFISGRVCLLVPKAARKFGNDIPLSKIWTI